MQLAKFDKTRWKAPAALRRVFCVRFIVVVICFTVKKQLESLKKERKKRWLAIFTLARETTWKQSCLAVTFYFSCYRVYWLHDKASRVFIYFSRYNVFVSKLHFFFFFLCWSLTNIGPNMSLKGKVSPIWGPKKKQFFY